MKEMEDGGVLYESKLYGRNGHGVAVGVSMPDMMRGAKVGDRLKQNGILGGEGKKP